MIGNGLQMLIHAAALPFRSIRLSVKLTVFSSLVALAILGTALYSYFSSTDIYMHSHSHAQKQISALVTFNRIKDIVYESFVDFSDQDTRTGDADIIKSQFRVAALSDSLKSNLFKILNAEDEQIVGDRALFSDSGISDSLFSETVSVTVAQRIKIINKLQYACAAFYEILRNQDGTSFRRRVHQETLQDASEALQVVRALVTEGEKEFFEEWQESVDGRYTLFHTFRTSLIFFTGGIILLIVFMAFALFQPIHEQMQKLKEALDMLARGNLDARSPVSAKNEFGLLSDSVNSMADTLSASIRSVQKVSKAMAEASDKVLHMYRNVHETTQNVSQRTNSVSAEAKSATQNVTIISSHAEKMSSSVGSVAEAIEEFRFSLNEVAKNCREESKIAAEADSQAKETLEKMQRLNNTSKEITKIVEMINDIAEQTNLLALNATIEAASAGEAGKGFAVVANEVKELAKLTAQATDEIEKQIEQMKSITENSVGAIGDISKVIDNVNIISQTIVTAVEEQTVTVNQVARNIGSASNAANEIAQNVQRTAGGLIKISTNIQKLDREVKTSSNGVQQMEEQTSEQKTLVNKLQGIVNRMFS